MSDTTSSFNEFNSALDRLIERNSGFDEPAAPTSTIAAGMAFADGADDHENTGTGKLVVQVYVASGALPVEGAKVTVTDADGNVVAERITDISGVASVEKLTAPAAEYSQQPGRVIPYSTYNILVSHPGYYTAQFLNVPVFDKNESIQPVGLIPLGENATENERITTVESGPTPQ